MSAPAGPSPAPRRRGRLGRAAAGLLRLAGTTLLLLLALEVGARLLLGAAHARRFGGPRGGRAPAMGEELHPFLQNANPPGARVEPGPELAGFPVEPPLAPGEPAAGAPGDGRCRLMFLGGSTMVFDLPSLVLEELARRGVRARAYVLAASWHASLHSLHAFWTHADAVRPHAAVVLHNVNDFYRGFTPPGLSLPVYRPDHSHFAGGLGAYWTARESRFDGRPVFYARPLDDEDGSLGGLLEAVGHSSVLVVQLRRRAARLLAPEPDEVHLPRELYLRALPAFARNLENLRLSCAAKDVPVLFLTMPFTAAPPERFVRRFLTNDGRSWLADEELAAGLRAFNQEVRALGAPPRAHVLDLEPLVGGEEDFRDEVHLTLAGKRKEAAAIAPFLLERGLLAGCAGGAPPAAAPVP